MLFPQSGARANARYPVLVHQGELLYCSLVGVNPWNDPLNWHSRDGHTFLERKARAQETLFSEVPAHGCGAHGDLRGCRRVGQELGVTRRCLYKWRHKLEAVEVLDEASRPHTRAAAHRKEILQLKRLLAEKALEVDFLKGALQKIEARRRRSSGSGEMASTNRSEK